MFSVSVVSCVCSSSTGHNSRDSKENTGEVARFPLQAERTFGHTKEEEEEEEEKIKLLKNDG